MEDVLFFYNPWWTKKAVPSHILKKFKREVFYKLKDYLKLNRILILKGPRRVGKTTVLYQIINTLLQEKIKPENILYLSLDDPKLKIDFDKIIDFYQTRILKGSIESDIVYIFLDEVQYLENWQYYVKKYFDRSYPVKFIISGSSATLIRKGTESLMGRTVEETLLPFSFKEFLGYHAKEKIELKSLDKIDLVSIKKYESKAKIFFEEYLLKGGFPNIFEIEEVDVWQKLMKEDIIDKAIYRDIVSLYDIKKPELLEKLFFYMAGITGQILNVSNVSNSIGLSREYVNKYLQYLKNALLLFTLKKYAKSVEKIIRSNEKAFILDQGIINSLLNKTKIDDAFAGHLVETVVLRHLLKYEVYYWKNYYEIDFVARVKNKITPIEVKYQAQITKADLKGLVKFMEKFKVKEGIVVTKDLFETQKVDGKGIKFIPAWLFLLTT
ncbi:MAG: ATP-binding protein [Candidatus Hydrothermarchaeota archaeon]|nr:ATP-binding protein [Candidatus Hydrothermarchaeota archaeon]